MPFKDFRRWILQKTRIGFTFALGRHLGSLFPAKIPLTLVFGAPIDVGCVPNPTQKQIDEVHAHYMERLCALFEKHKQEYGYGDRTLAIM